MATLVISPLFEYGSFKTSNPSTHKGQSLQGRRSPVNNSSHQRRNSTSTHFPKAVSPPHRPQPSVSPVFQRSISPASLNRKLERAMSEPADRRAPAAAQSNSSRYKTELCRPYEENGTCKYGDKCQFAHGLKELRTLARHPKYKTELCRSFHTTGLCPYGPRCHFIHNSDQAKAAGYSAGSNSVLSRPKALSSSSEGSSGENSPPSSVSASPTLFKSSDDLFQFPVPTTYPIPSSQNNPQRGSYDYTTDEFNPDRYETNNIFQERYLSSVLGSSVSVSSADGLDLDCSSLCGSPNLDVFQPSSISPSFDSGFANYPFSFFGKQDP